MRRSLWIVLACSVGLAGAGLVVCRSLSGRPDEPSEAVAAVGESGGQPLPSGRAVAADGESGGQPLPSGRPAPRVDCFGDPLPQGALARLGTLRLRHPEGIESVAFSSDGKTVASGGGRDGEATVRLWDVATGKEVRTLQGHPKVVFSPDGKTVASWGGTNHGTVDVRLRIVRLWDVATGKEIRTLEGHKGNVHSVTFLSDGKTMASGGDDDTVYLWEVATGKLINMIRLGARKANACMAFSPDGKIVASLGWPDDRAAVHLWEVTTGKEIRTLRGHKEELYAELYAVAFSSDGKTVASGGKDNVVCLWEVATGKKLRTLQGHEDVVGRGGVGSGGVRGVAFSPNGRIVASGGWDGTVRLWEAASGKPIHILKGHQRCLYNVAFSPDGKTVAAGGVDRSVHLWEVATGKEIRTQGHQRRVISVAYSSDGKTVASGGGDGTVRLWEAATGKEIRSLQGHKWWVTAVALSPDGKTVVSGEGGGGFRGRAWGAGPYGACVGYGHRQEDSYPEGTQM